MTFCAPRAWETSLLQLGYTEYTQFVSQSRASSTPTTTLGGHPMALAPPLCGGLHSNFTNWPLLSFVWGLGMAPGLNYCLGPFGLASFTPLKPVFCGDYCTWPSLTASLGGSLGPAKLTMHWPRGNILFETCRHHEAHKILFQWSWFFSPSFSSSYRLFFLTIF